MSKLGLGGTWSGNIDGKTAAVIVLSINLSNPPGFAQVCISEGVIGHGILAGKYLTEYRDSLK